MSENFFIDDLEFVPTTFPWDSVSEQDENYLNIDDIFIEHPSTKIVDQIEEEFNIFPNDNEESNSKVAPLKKKKPIKKDKIKEKQPPESFYTKNVCFNICQKTIKIISKGEYQQKLDEICSEFNFDAVDFENSIVKKKKDFTGPKALKYFIDEESIESKIFSKFMKWFLENKYLRHALKNGEMNNIESYITYKNEVLMNILK